MAKDDQDKRAQIWNFVLEHEGFFCDPPPEGLGFPRPGMIPGHYLKRPEEWALDKIRVQKLKRERQLRDGTADRTVSTGMAPGTRQLLDDIRRLTREGHAPADISAQLDVTEAGDPQRPGPGTESLRSRAPRDPSRYRRLAAFQRTWGRPWSGGHTNANGGNGHRKPQSAI